MALLSELVRIVAKVEGLDEVSVGIFARHAREAGHLSQGGRGRSAAKMSVSDAANLLIAVNGCTFAKDVSLLVPKFRELKVKLRTGEGLTGIGCGKGNFGDDLEKLIELHKIGKDKKLISEFAAQTFIRFYRPSLSVEIKTYPKHKRINYSEHIVYGNLEEIGSWSHPDRSEEIVISHVTLGSVARAIFN